MALLATALTAQATNTLRSHGAIIEAPDGMVYDSDMSRKMDMDVFRTRDNTLIFAIGTQKAIEGVSALSLTAVIARGNGGKVVKVPGRDIYATFDNRNKRVYGVCQADGDLPVVLIIGNISNPSAMHYLASLRPA